VVMLIFQFIFLYNYISSAFRGPKAEKNPWKANTLEWHAASPPPHGNFPVMPTVYRGPYEYSHPDRKQDYWPQHIPDEASAK
jgi:cytochrome c oxidase subunit 1